MNEKSNCPPRDRQLSKFVNETLVTADYEYVKISFLLIWKYSYDSKRVMSHTQMTYDIH